MPAQNQLGPGEYLNLARHPKTKLLYDVCTAGTNLSSLQPLSNTITIAYGEGKISGGFHHGAAIGEDGNVYAYAYQGQNLNNIACTGAATISGLVKTPIGNATFVKSFNNSVGQNYGSGIAAISGGKVLLLGNTQSGFRGDGSAGSVSETTPFTVPIPVAVTKIVGLQCLFALGVDGKVYRWGGQGVGDYQMQFICGAFSSSPDFTRVGTVNLPESITDIAHGNGWTYAKGASGKWYAWGYDGGFFLRPDVYQQLGYYDVTNTLPKGNIIKLRCGLQATYCLMDDGSVYSWGDNMQAAIGNGQEGMFSNYTAPWPGIQLTMPNGGQITLPVLTPYKMNPAGISFVDLWVDNSLAMYYFLEDTNGNLWSGGRNKTFNLWNGVGGDSNTQGANPNKWDVLKPTSVAGFGSLSVVSPPPANKPPVVSIAQVPAITLPSNVITLDGSASADPDGTIASYAWSQVSGPLAAIIGTGSKVQALLSTPGTYVFQLTATDNQGASGSGQVSVVLNPISAPRTVTGVKATVNATVYAIPLSWLSFTFSDGTTQ
jgi:hypothetical protein